MDAIRIEVDSLFLFSKYKCQEFSSSNALKEEKMLGQVGWVGRNAVERIICCRLLRSSLQKKYQQVKRRENSSQWKRHWSSKTQRFDKLKVLDTSKGSCPLQVEPLLVISNFCWYQNMTKLWSHIYKKKIWEILWVLKISLPSLS